MARKSKFFSRLILGLLITSAAWLSAAPLCAQDLAQQAPSLKLIPADAAAYNVMLRNREQIEIVLKSKAWAKLTSLPFVQMGKQEFMKGFNKEWENSDNPVPQWFKNPANAEILQFLIELGSDEIFFFAAKNNGDFVNLIQSLVSANQMAGLARLIKEGPAGQQRPEDMIRTLLTVLDAQGDKLKFPDLVVGFKFSKSKPADVAKKLDNLMQEATNFAKGAPPPFNNLLKKLQVNGNDVHALVLDGQLVPWDDIPFNSIEEQPGQFNKLIARLKAMKLTLTLSVRDNFLLVTIGEGTAGLQSLGQGKLLVDRDEFKPVAKVADRQRVTTLNYISKDFLTAVAGAYDLDKMMKSVNDLLKETDLPAGQQARIKKDVKDCLTDLKRLSPEVGAQLGVSFLTDTGVESYHYNWTKNHGLDSTKPLTLLEHVGGNPLAFSVSRTPIQIENYNLLVKWLKVGFDYFEELALPHFPPEGRQVYKDTMKQVMPLLVRLDKATGTMLLPSLDGQSGLIVDAKLSSKQWHMEMPKTETALPGPELAVIIGLRDSALFAKAMVEYRDIINGFIEVIAKMSPNGLPPEIKISNPQAHINKNGFLYSYPIPEKIGLDKQILPTAGLSDKLIAFTLSEAHANRLLEKKPLQAKDGLTIDATKPLASATYFDWAGFVDAATPWVNFAVDKIEQEQKRRGDFQPAPFKVEPFKPGEKEFKDKSSDKKPEINFQNDKGQLNQREFQEIAFQEKGPANKEFAAIRAQVDAVLQILKVCRGFTSITYIEDDVIVTHTRTIFKDLDK